MTHLSHSVESPYSPKQLYMLVDDVQSYPQFVPWCHRIQVLWQQGNQRIVNMAIKKGPVCRSFATKNRCYPYERIELSLEEGPFRHLDGCWRFTPVSGGQGCITTLDMDFSFSNPLVEKAFGPVFSQVLTAMSEAFNNRAHELYGNLRNAQG